MPVHKRGDTYQVKLKLPNVDRITATFRSEAEATAYEYECRAAHAKGHTIPSVASRNSKAARVNTIGELVEHCWEVRWSQLQSSKAGEKCSPYECAKLFSKWAGPNLPVATVLTTERLDQYSVYRRVERRNIGRTVNKYLAAISVLVEKANDLKLIPSDFKLPWQPRHGDDRERVFTNQEEAELLELMLRLGRQDFHDYFVVFIETGIRPRELKLLPWKDIGDTRITVHHSIAKIGKTRKVPCSPRARVALQRVRERAPEATRPFHWATASRVRDFWDLLRENLAWMDKTTVPYTCRHTRCSRWANDRRIPLAETQRWMGHKNIATTQKYMHPTEESDDFDGLIDRLYSDNPKGAPRGGGDELAQALAAALNSGGAELKAKLAALLVPA